MIISASRRTDIPAFYAEWFMNRIRAGYCTVPNPYNPKRVAQIDLRPDEVDAIVFWTRNPRPLLRHLSELDTMGYSYYFQFTLMDNPPLLDQAKPRFDATIATFHDLAAHVGPGRVIWRYDPIIFSNQTGVDFHTATYGHIAAALDGATTHSVISIMDDYRKIRGRLNALKGQGLDIRVMDATVQPQLDALMGNLKAIADSQNLEITSCAEELDLAQHGILPGKCVDNQLIAKILGVDVDAGKDKSQRAACGCVTSRDIGMYNSCLFGCQYCYATSSFAKARENHAAHDPSSPALLGWHEAQTTPTKLT